MKKISATSILLLSLLPPLASAGVMMDMVTRNSSGQEIDRTRVYAESELIRMDQVDGDSAVASMIFLGDEFLYVDHREKSYIVMDEAMLDEVSAQISDAMKQMEAELAVWRPTWRK